MVRVRDGIERETSSGELQEQALLIYELCALEKRILSYSL